MGRKSRQKRESIGKPRLTKRQRDGMKAYLFCKNYMAKRGFTLSGKSQCNCNVPGAIQVIELPKEQQGV